MAHDRTALTAAFVDAVGAASAVGAADDGGTADERVDPPDASLDAARSVAADLLAAYEDPHRHYHGVAHLRAVLTVADDLLTADGLLTADLDAPTARRARSTVHLAAWFHDAVYDARAADNEERSARWAAAALPALGVPSEVVEEVVALVVATTTHDLDAVADLAGGLAFLDADLAVLGAPPVHYDAYAAAIRQEYRHVPDEAFRTGRAGVLERFLGRSALYGSPTGRARYESAARRNLQRELDSLRAPSAGDGLDL